MTEINSISQNQYNTYSTETNKTEEDLSLEDISILYTTEKTENERTTFDETFNEEPIEETEFGEEFLKGLTENKEELCTKLDLSSEEYDNLACIALALASQETGFGEEDGYKSENQGLKKVIRSVAKKIDSFLGNGSASSGLTQIKIYDFLNTDKLTDEQKSILEDLGIEADNVSKDNLYQNPDKAAAATLVILSSLADNYDNYTNTLSSEHENIAKNLDDNLSEEERINKGSDILDNIQNVCGNLSSDEKEEIRTTFKQWLLSENGSTISDKVDEEYNEEIQLNKLNELLSSAGSDLSLEQEDLNYIRYALTAEGNEMTETEYCAYAWNKGTEETGMQLDRMLADKIGTILNDPESYDYDQFTVNVTSLAEKYASQL